jgi:toxin ParE1/3/4
MHAGKSTSSIRKPEKRSATTATTTDHLREIERSCGRLLRNPQLGKARDELSPGIRTILIDPHVAFYRVTGVTVEIVRVLHQHEDVDVIFH